MKISQRTAFAIAIGLGAFALVGGTGLTVSSAWLITMASAHPPILLLGVSIVLVRFFGIFRSIARYGERVISHEAIFRRLTTLRVGLFQSFSRQLSSKSGEISERTKALVDDVERAQEFHLRVSLPGISAAIAGFITVGIALWINPIIAIFPLSTYLILAIFIPWAVRKYLDPISVEIEESENLFAEMISTAAHAMVEADIYGYGERYRESLNDSSQRLRELERKFYRRLSCLALLATSAVAASLVSVSASLHNEQNLAPVQISMAIFLALVGFEGYTSWFPNLFPAGKIRRAAETIEQISNVEVIEKSPNSQPRTFNVSASKCIPYWSTPFLKPVTLDIHPGETIVLSGLSGVGKTTFAAALLGFAKYAGSLTIGGVEVRDIANLERYITASMQNPHIFNTTLRENLKIARDSVSDSELRVILSALELDYIELDEILGEFGRPLSGGEAKRVALSRALISDAPIVILDEPTEHLDHELALRIEREITRLTSDRALIVISHSPWLKYWRKLVLERE